MQGQEEVVKIRTHFAVAFTKGDGQEKDTNRKVIIRNAFNSPFRPFVLATTSIGQEGLDFHNYCRRIVHWNLPSNPIDLEQREGRINRFECLAIRQNVAKRYGNIQFKNDIWVEDLQAKIVEAHERVVAQEIETETITAEGSIIVGRILAVDELALSHGKIICGETAYGSGRIAASVVMTGEPIDLDDGEDAIDHPNVYEPDAAEAGAAIGRDTLINTSREYSATNNYKEYIDFIMETVPWEDKANSFGKWAERLETIESVMDDCSSCRDLSLLVWLTEIVNSEVFCGWETLEQWYEQLTEVFEKLCHNKPPVEVEPTDLKSLALNDVVSHDVFGQGSIESITNTPSGKQFSVRFQRCGVKKFMFVPSTMVHFKLIAREGANYAGEFVDYKNSITCTASDYAEWIDLLRVLNTYGKYFETDLFNLAFDLVTAQLGLKGKFVSDRFREKGWKPHV